MWASSILPVIAAAIFTWMNLKWNRFPRPLIVNRPNSSYDYIVVGAGTTGGTLAARLSEDTNSTTLVLEAGMEGGDSLYEIPRTNWLTINTEADWEYQTVSQKSAMFSYEDQSSFWPRGKILGGSSQLNAMLHVRGSKHDYDEWADMGCKGWAWKDVLPYFLKMEYTEDETLLGSGYHARNGALKIINNIYCSFTETFIQAGVELGYKKGNINGESQEVFGSSFWNIVDGKRGGSAQVYLRPAMHRKNLHVTTRAHVTKVIIKGERAVGVEFIHNGRKRSVLANKEVILSAGTIGSPQILMLSGIGPEKHLQNLQIPLIKNLPVGEGLEDHMNTGFKFFATKSTSSIIYPIDSIWERLKYKLTENSLLYGTPGLGTDANAFLRLGEFWNKPYPNVQLYLTPPNNEAEIAKKLLGAMNLKKQGMDYLLSAPPGLPDDVKPFSIYVSLINAKSRGTIRLKSKDPFDYPDIDPHYLEENEDVLSTIQGIRVIQRLVETPSFKKFGVVFGETPYAPCMESKSFDTDEYWECYLRHFSFTVFHPTSTCRMGSVDDNHSVVDPELRVKGIIGLRVADASIMPVGTSGNINAACFMIGEKAADIILGRTSVSI